MARLCGVRARDPSGISDLRHVDKLPSKKCSKYIYSGIKHDCCTLGNFHFLHLGLCDRYVMAVHSRESCGSLILIMYMYIVTGMYT